MKDGGVDAKVRFVYGECAFKRAAALGEFGEYISLGFMRLGMLSDYLRCYFGVLTDHI